MQNAKYIQMCIFYKLSSISKTNTILTDDRIWRLQANNLLQIPS